MAERFGSQTHPSGGQRFGSQTYAALSGAISGTLAATEAGADTFAAASLPRINGAMDATEAGSDTFALSAHASINDSMAAYEAPTPDTFIAAGKVTDNSVSGALRFGAQAHPSGGLRFGAQSWGGLGPLAVLAAIESGSDTFAGAGWLASPSYQFAIYTIDGAFVDYGSESLGAGVTGSLDTGYKVLLPIQSISGGLSFEWEVNQLGNPSLRLARLTGASSIVGVPWYVWDGAAWTLGLFDVSDSMQGAVFMVEAGQDTAFISGASIRFGSVAMTEAAGPDFTQISGGVRIVGAAAVSEPVGADVFTATGAPSYEGDVAMVDGGPDIFESLGGIASTGAMVATEAATSDAFAAAGGLAATGALAATESGADAFAAAGAPSIAGSLDVTESATADTFTAAGGVLISGSVSLSEAATKDAFAAAGSIERLGILAAIESGGDVSLIEGIVIVSGDVGAVETVSDRFRAIAVRESTGDVGAIEAGGDLFVGRGYLGDPAPLITFDGPVIAISGTPKITVRSRRTSESA